MRGISPALSCFSVIFACSAVNNNKKLRLFINRKRDRPFLWCECLPVMEQENCKCDNSAL